MRKLTEAEPLFRAITAIMDSPLACPLFLSYQGCAKLYQLSSVVIIRYCDYLFYINSKMAILLGNPRRTVNMF